MSKEVSFDELMDSLPVEVQEFFYDYSEERDIVESGEAL